LDAEFLAELDMSQYRLAKSIHVPPRRINEIVLGKRAITPVMSIRFGAFFGQSDTFWHGIQVECDFRALARKRKQLVSGIQPATSLATTH
jgi:addiction module HigA family antidote